MSKTQTEVLQTAAKQAELTLAVTEQAKSPKEVKRVRLDYNATLNHIALKEQEGLILSNFTELVKKVIMIDGKPFDEATYINGEGQTVKYKLTTGRRLDFLRMIEEYAIIEFTGAKCHIRAVFGDEAKEQIKNAELQKRVDKIKNT